jgi:transporter family protein
MPLWLIYAAGAAVFCAATTILAKIGLRGVDSHLAMAIRTVAVLFFVWPMAAAVGIGSGIADISGVAWAFLVLSAFATGASWLCFYRALSRGDVNKVLPIDKSSTLLTMGMAFIILGEPVSLTTIPGIVLMGAGTWFMIEFKQEAAQPKGKGWLLYAVFAAVFASATAIFTSLGVAEVDATLWTALRTTIIVPLSWLVVFTAGSHKHLHTVSARSLIFLLASGVATGGSWLLFNHALAVGPASHVVPIDRMSILLAMGFARIFLGERYSKRSLLGLAMLAAGTLLVIV